MKTLWIGTVVVVIIFLSTISNHSLEAKPKDIAPKAAPADVAKKNEIVVEAEVKNIKRLKDENWKSRITIQISKVVSGKIEKKEIVFVDTATTWHQVPQGGTWRGVIATDIYRFTLKPVDKEMFYSYVSMKLIKKSNRHNLKSDIFSKENIKDIDGPRLRELLRTLPIYSWNYKDDEMKSRHIGPMAQDFMKIYQLGDNDKVISTLDTSALSLAVIKELDNEIVQLKKENKEIKDLLNKILSDKAHSR